MKGLSESTRKLGESRQDVGPEIRLVIASLACFLILKISIYRLPNKVDSTILDRLCHVFDQCRYGPMPW